MMRTLARRNETVYETTEGCTYGWRRDSSVRNNEYLGLNS